jgi:hypothetical protein
MQPRNEKFFLFAGKARTPSSAPPFSRSRADLLLAGLAAEQVVHWLRDEHRVLTDLAGSLCSAALALAQQSNHSETAQAKYIV